MLGKGDPLFEIQDGLKGFSPRVGFAWTPLGNQRTVLRGGLGAFKEMPLVYIYQLAIDAPPYATRYQINRPNLKFPFPFSAANFDPSKAAAGEPLLLPLDFKMPYTLQWNFSLEQQLGQTFVVKAVYLGTRSVDQVGVYNANTQPAQIVNGRLSVSATAKVPNPNFNSFYYTAPIGNQFYHALQLVVEKRFSGGLRFNSSNTFSRNIDQVSGLSKAAENITGAPLAIYNANDFSAEKGLASIDVRNNFTFSYTYELPFGSGQRWGSQWKGPVNYVLGGWVINGTNTVRSGLPTSLTMTPRQSRCLQQQCQERPDLIPGGNNNPVLDNWTPDKYFDPSQFVVQPLGFYGNLGRNTLISPGQFNMNFSLSKDNRLGERKNLEFRAEFFNFLNHPNFGGPAVSLFRNAAGDLTPNVGRITSTADSMRQIQFGLKLTF
ncbi:MAG: hypothetical protein HY647_11995 [Acidobacteria bacterium]|nr:hypothetical protein [Acidobacteriota bacterium]